MCMCYAYILYLKLLGNTQRMLPGQAQCQRPKQRELFWQI